MQAASQQQASLQAEIWQTPQGAGLQTQTSEDGVATERSQLAAEGTRPSQGRSSCGDPFGGSGASPPLWGQQALQVGGAAPPQALGDADELHLRNQQLREEILGLRRQLQETQQRERTAIARLSIMPSEEPAHEEGAHERGGARVTSEYFKPLTTTEAQGCKISMTQPLARSQLASALETIRAKMPKNRFLATLTSTELSRERRVSYDITGARVVTKSELRREFDSCAGEDPAEARAVSEYVGAQLKIILSISGTPEADAFVTEHVSKSSGIFANGAWLIEVIHAAGAPKVGAQARLAQDEFEKRTYATRWRAGRAPRCPSRRARRRRTPPSDGRRRRA